MSEEISQNQLAKELGWSVQRLLWHRKNKPDAPQSNDPAAWRRYALAHSYVTTQGSDKKIAKSIAQTKLDILEEVKKDKVRSNKLKDNELFDSKEVTPYVAGLVAFFFAELDRLANEYPVTLKGKTEIPIHEECVRQTKAIKKALADKVKTWDEKKKTETEVPAV